METELEGAKDKQCHNDEENILKFGIRMIGNRTQQNKGIKREIGIGNASRCSGILRNET